MPALSFALQNKKAGSTEQSYRFSSDQGTYIFNSDNVSPSFDFIAEIEEKSLNEEAKIFPFILIKLSCGFINSLEYLISTTNFPFQKYSGVAVFLINRVFRI